MTYGQFDALSRSGGHPQCFGPSLDWSMSRINISKVESLLDVRLG